MLKRGLALELDECNRDAHSSVSEIKVQPAGHSSMSEDVRQHMNSSIRDQSKGSTD